MHYNCKSLHVVIKYLISHYIISPIQILFVTKYPISTPYCETLRLDKDEIH